MSAAATAALQLGRKTNALDVCRHFAAEIKGSTVLITGPTKGGIGYATAVDIAQQSPAKLILVGRDLAKLEESRKGVLEVAPKADVPVVQCDLSSLASVRAAAEQIGRDTPTIDYFIANAGVMDAPYRLTAEGFELQLVTNYLSHYVMLGALLPSVLSSAKKTVVLVASSAHARGAVQWDDPSYRAHEYNKNQAYGQSKSAMILYARALAQENSDKGLRVQAVNPGPTMSDLTRHWSLQERIDIGRLYGGAFNEQGVLNPKAEIWKTVEQGASTTCVAAFDSTLPNGVWLDDCVVSEEKCQEWAKDPVLVDKIKGWTEELIQGSAAKEQ